MKGRERLIPVERLASVLNFDVCGEYTGEYAWATIENTKQTLMV